MVEYRNIPGFPGYQVGSDGSIWTCWKRSGGKATGGSWDNSLSQWINTGVRLKPLMLQPHKKYLKVLIPNGGKKIKLFAHVAVLLAFSGPKPEGMISRHLDGNARNNTPLNLAWGTKKENANDRLRHGTEWKAKLTEEQVLLILESSESRHILAERYGVTTDSISNILAGRTWQHLTGNRRRTTQASSISTGQ